MEKIQLSEQEIIRREKLEFLKEKNIAPFGQRFDRDTNSAEFTANFESFTKDELAEKNSTVKVAGRIMTKRGQGKAGFMTIQDRDGFIQVYVRKDSIGDEAFEVFEKGDIGDIVGIEGVAFKTNTDQLSVKAVVYTHLTKALRPLPDKHAGLQDVEEARRRRYVDLLVNDDSKRIALTRPKIIRAIQNFFDSKGFLEVETPVLHPILGGAAARPFVTHHNTLDMPFYLRIATELPLKRLIVGGMEAVYEIGRLFRNEGMSHKHNPEFTTIEAYLAYSDMSGMMDLVEECISSLCMTINNTYEITFNEKSYNLAPGFKRWHMVDAVKEVTGVDFWQEMSFKDAAALAKKHHVEVPKHYTGVGHIVNAFFEKFVEEKLEQPTFVYGHPVEISPLAKMNDKDPRYTDRFELFIGTTEYANAFSELNDPIDQLQRFEEQIKEKDLGNDEATEIDMDFVEALQYGMPPCGGLGIGIDRLIMLLTGTTNIRDIILFPHMKNK
ncbi:MAG: lysine--tRNA ligase [bacterium]